MNIKVSIIVPVYNVEKYLVECLNSLINQSLKEIEIICGDGGSTDNSLNILREFEKKDSRIKVISRKNSGYGQSVNECISLAKGEYIGIVESDDKVKKNMYKTLYYYAKKYELDWIRSDIYFYYPNKFLKKTFRESATYNGNYYNTVLNPQNDIRPYRSTLHTWAGIYNRNFLNKYDIKHNETDGGSFQDVGFYLKTLYYAKRVYFLDKPFYMWRQDNPNSSIHYNSKKLVEKSFKEWELNKEYLQNNPNVNNRMWESYNYRRYFSYLWTIDMAIGQDKKEAKEYARKELKEAMEKGQVSPDFFSVDEWKEFQRFIG